MEVNDSPVRTGTHHLSSSAHLPKKTFNEVLRRAPVREGAGPHGPNSAEKGSARVTRQDRGSSRCCRFVGRPDHRSLGRARCRPVIVRVLFVVVGPERLSRRPNETVSKWLALSHGGVRMRCAEPRRSCKHYTNPTHVSHFRTRDFFLAWLKVNFVYDNTTVFTSSTPCLMRNRCCSRCA